MSVAIVFAVSCSRDEAKVIPRPQLSEIYAEMLLTDQWILSTKGVRLIADTSLVYKPILEKYGYTTEDYMKTVDVYMDDPERFAKVLRTTSEILGERQDKLRKKKERLDAEAAREKERKKMEDILRSDLDMSEFFPYLHGEPYVHYYDSLSFEPDSALLIYRLVSIERADTIYDRIRMIVKTDTLSVCDSVPSKDTVVSVRPVMRIEQELKSEPELLKVQEKTGKRKLDGQIRRMLVEDGNQ